MYQNWNFDTLCKQCRYATDVAKIWKQNVARFARCYVANRSITSFLKKDCTFAKNSAQTYFPFRRWQLTQQLTTCRSTPNNNKNWGRRKTFNHYFFISLKRSKPSHSVSKFHFWSRNYKFWKSLKNHQFLFLCQNWLFLAGKTWKYLNFRA